MLNSRYNPINELFYVAIERVLGRSFEQGAKGQKLHPHSLIYVERNADEELWQFLVSDRFTSPIRYILAAPKMGKSSLLEKTIYKLSQAHTIHYIAIAIELKPYREPISEDFFYFRLLQIICEILARQKLAIANELNAVWESDRQNHPRQKCREFLQRILVAIGDRTLAIFIDDIQHLLHWNLQDSWTQFVRSLSDLETNLFKRLKFVLFGVASPYRLIPDLRTTGDRSHFIELTPFQDNQCQSLLSGLKKATANPNPILQEIMNWTRGQSFLTILLCYKLYRKSRKGDKREPKEQIKNLVIQERFFRDVPLVLHFKQVADFLIRGDPDELDRKHYTLNLYARILQGQSIQKDENSRSQTDLLVSGLVGQSEKYLQIANPIYQQIFTQQWVEQTQNQLKQRRSKMPSSKIYNRDVYMLIDQSGSMVKRDDVFNKKRRWEAIPEVIESHVYNILNHQGMNGEKICDEITITLFSPNRPATVSRIIQDDSQVADIFEENQPDSNTFITPTMAQVLDRWFGTRNNQGGFVIVYTDGSLDDPDQFVNLVETTCRKLNSQDELKVIIVGFGSDINRDPKFYLRLDANTSSFLDQNAKPCNIVVFDLLNKMSGIIDLLNRQLENPQAGLAEWGREFCPELY
ncbi:MAG: AAA-like domain-containing protein [Cyanobacteria bacterium SBLK]|nr:AAA-like domain-containing protein [Cyanobacteria bacterium SBLK]